MFMLHCAQSRFRVCRVQSVPFATAGSHDFLLVPSRSLVEDVCPPSRQPRALAIFTTVEMLGRLGALIIGALPTLPASAWGSVSMTSADEQLRTLILASGLVLLASAAACVLSAKEQPLRPVPLPLPSTEAWSSCSREGLLEGNDGEDGGNSEAGTGGRVRRLGEEAGSAGALTAQLAYLRGTSRAVWLLLLTQVVCWVGLMVWCFYCTTWISLEMTLSGTSLHLALVGLSGQAILSVFTAALIDSINRKCGTKRVLFAGGLQFHLLMAAAGYWGGSGSVTQQWLSVGFTTASGAGYAIISNNAFAIVEEFDPDNEVQRGANLSLVNNALPVAQILVGALAGVAITALGGSGGVYPNITAAAAGGLQDSNGDSNDDSNEVVIGRLFVIVGLGVSGVLLALLAVDVFFRVIPVR